MSTTYKVFFSRQLIFIIFAALCSSCATTNRVTPTEITLVEQFEENGAEGTAKASKSNELPLGVGDILDIEVYRHEDLHRSVRIDEMGKIYFPLIGDVEAAGLSAAQLQSKIQGDLTKYFVNPQVFVGVKTMNSQKVYVLGEVSKPGILNLNSPTSILEAISSSGGFTLDANGESVMVIRGSRTNPQLAKLNLESVMSEGDLSQNIRLKGGDIVYIPSTYIADASRFAVYLRNILTPILMLEQGIVLGDDVSDVLQHDETTRESKFIINTH